MWDMRHLKAGGAAMLVGVLVGLGAAGVSCKKKEEPATASCPGNPAGSVTSAIRTSGNGANSIDFDTGTVGNCCTSTWELFIDTNDNFTGLGGSTITDVGAVCGLGAITTDPNTGYVASQAATTGHGYILKTAAGAKWRIYVQGAIISSTSGGVIGETIVWASLP
jgi:hypothetical protein